MGAIGINWQVNGKDANSCLADPGDPLRQA